jgi:hypothetical protein
VKRGNKVGNPCMRPYVILILTTLFKAFAGGGIIYNFFTFLTQIKQFS